MKKNLAVTEPVQPKTPGRLAEAINRALAVEQRFQAQEKLVMSGLTAESYVAACEIAAGFERKTRAADPIEILAQKLETPGFEALGEAVERMKKCILGDEGPRLSVPTTKISYLFPENARLQLATAGATQQAAFALAARTAAAQRPGAFGGCSDMNAEQQKLDRLQSELKAATEALATAWEPADLIVSESDDDPPSFLRFSSLRLAGKDLGRRILDAARAERDKAKAA